MLPRSVLGDRTYQLWTPDHGVDVPLVLVLHGTGSNGYGMAGLTGFTHLARQEGFAVCYPDALNRTWNAATPGGTDDLGFLSDLLTALGSGPAFVCGMSNGAALASAFAIANPELVRALGTVCGGLTGQMLRWLGLPTGPLPIRAYYGSADLIWPIDGYPNAMWGEQLLGAVDTLTIWHTANGGDDALTAVVTVEGGGHCWPGGSQYLPAALIGDALPTPNATEELWQFFQGVVT
jgi:polyhydroxybutyrate depolymerase